MVTANSKTTCIELIIAWIKTCGAVPFTYDELAENVQHLSKLRQTRFFSFVTIERQFRIVKEKNLFSAKYPDYRIIEHTRTTNDGKGKYKLWQVDYTKRL